jgi:hypothetical protein
MFVVYMILRSKVAIESEDMIINDLFLVFYLMKITWIFYSSVKFNYQVREMRKYLFKAMLRHKQPVVVFEQRYLVIDGRMVFNQHFLFVVSIVSED